MLDPKTFFSVVIVIHITDNEKAEKKERAPRQDAVDFVRQRLEHCTEISSITQSLLDRFAPRRSAIGVANCGSVRSLNPRRWQYLRGTGESICIRGIRQLALSKVSCVVAEVVSRDRVRQHDVQQKRAPKLDPRKKCAMNIPAYA